MHVLSMRFVILSTTLILSVDSSCFSQQQPQNINKIILILSKGAIFLRNRSTLSQQGNHLDMNYADQLERFQEDTLYPALSSLRYQSLTLADSNLVDALLSYLSAGNSADEMSANYFAEIYLKSTLAITARVLKQRLEMRRHFLNVLDLGLANYEARLSQERKGLANAFKISLGQKD